MTTSNTAASSSGVGLSGALFLIFLVLKLAEIGTVATWSWWWVTSPLWLPAMIAMVVIAIMVPIALLGTRRRRKYDV